MCINDPLNPVHDQRIKDLRKRGVSIQPEAQNFRMLNCTFLDTISDAHMYCVTSKRNDNYWKDILDDKKKSYDCCIEIKDFYEFSRRINIALKDQGIQSECYINKCFTEVNTGVIADCTTKNPDYFRKTPKYEIQQEIRAVFIPKTPQNSLSPITLYIDTNDLIIY